MKQRVEYHLQDHPDHSALLALQSAINFTLNDLEFGDESLTALVEKFSLDERGKKFLQAYQLFTQGRPHESRAP